MSLTLNQKLELIKFSEENMSKAKRLSFPGGSVIRNQPANAGDMGLLPDPGRSHLLRSS